jgi:hypothetical protein
MKIIKSVLLVATAFLTTTPLRAAQDVKGWPGWKQQSFDEAWDKARNRHNLPASHPKPFPIGGKWPGAGATECNPKGQGDPKVYDIALFVDQIKDNKGITDNADLNSPEVIESMAKTLTHELNHQCLRNAGVACAPPGDSNEMCEEMAVDFATSKQMCDEVGDKCQELCDKKAAADTPPTPAQQAEIDKLESAIAQLCKAIEEIRDKYNGGTESEKYSEQLCLCVNSGWTGSGSCPDVVLPPLPPNPTPGSDNGGGSCDYPEGVDQELIPECAKCKDCGCPPPPDPPEEDQ